MTSWLDFVFRSAPWHWKLYLAVTLPLWAARINKTWLVAGGWQQSYGQRRVVGVKSPRLLQLADRSIGERFFIQEADLREKVQSITCHELTHAYSAHLRLPTWLKEGLAMVTVDRYFGKPTVQVETLERIERLQKKDTFAGQQRLRVGDADALVDLYTRAYWLTRYIQETQPKLLKNLLSRHSQAGEMEDKIAAAYGKSRELFWSEIDGVLVGYFK